MGVAILDCGAQYAKVIDRRIRELGVESFLLPVDTPAETLKEYEAIILSGGPDSVNDDGSPRVDEAVFELGIPVLGVCYGMQLMAHHFQGKIGQKETKEYGETIIAIKASPLFTGLEEREQVLMSHGDSVLELPEGFTAIAHSHDIIAAMANDEKKMYGVQFHPEVDLTLNGKQVYHNFLFGIANVEKSHNLELSVEKSVKKIRETVGTNNVAVLISGGVDSAVTAALLRKALPKEQIYGIHIDHGFMRKDESRTVMEALTALDINVKLVEAAQEFQEATTTIDGKESCALKDAVDPEVKRKIIGDCFITLSDRELKSIPGTVYLAQGTLRPDLIESASSLVSSTAETIKTHHNDSDLVRRKRAEGLVIETNKDWHKDEVRTIGKELGLPDYIVQRQPFPGPGLAIRCLCADTADEIDPAPVQEIAKAYDLEADVLPIKSVGVQGDGRTYSYVSIVNGHDTWEQIKAAASEIPRKVHTVNRVCYSFGEPGPVQTSRLSKDRLDLLREADAIVREHLKEYPFAQVPVILLPNNSLVLRPFITNDFMTGRAAILGEELPWGVLRNIVKELAALNITSVLYDLTSKPPGTTEWE
ncbi:MAG: glutamine-hydrolyzing GMP synthase [Candidatus Woesearchaeota archaeon]|nr:glutamine-hydrolyzing GMP synthase [Candidatus Woesearchaeota archaeon]